MNKNTQDVKSLLNKGSLKGEEVAKAIFIDWGFLMEQIKNKVAFPKPLFTAEEKEILINKIENQDEYNIYWKYMTIKNWVNDNYKSLMTYEQQLWRIEEELHNDLRIIELSEELKTLTNYIPRAKTEREFSELLKGKIKELMENDRQFNYFFLFKEVLNWYNILKRKQPRKKNPLTALKKELTKGKIKDDYIVRWFSRNGGEISKWEMILHSEYLPEFYPCFEYPTDETKETEYLKSFTKFKKDFKPVYEMLLREISPYYPEISKLKRKEWLNSAGTFKDLESKKIFDLETVLSEDSYLLSENKRDKRNGFIVVADEKDLDKYLVELPPLKKLDKIMEDLSNPDFIKAYEHENRQLKASLYYIQGFNTALDLIKKHYKIQELDYFKSDIAYIKETMDKYNKLINTVKDIIEENFFYRGFEKERKKELIDQAFYKVDLEELKAPKENINKAYEIIKEENDFSNIKDFLSLIADLDMVE